VNLVLDQSKAVIPGAEVSATNEEASVNCRITTFQSGYYQFPLLPPKNLRGGVQARKQRPV